MGMRERTQLQYLETRAVYDFDIADQRNTKSMDMRPESPDEYAELDKVDTGQNGMKLLPVFSGEAFQAAVAFPVIVEAWDKKNSGRRQREWLQAFTQAERNKLGKFHRRFYRWYLVTGVPKRVSVNMATLELLQKAVNWFASI